MARAGSKAGSASGYEKFVMDADQLGMMQVLAKGIDLSENGQAMDAIREVGPGSHFLGCAHTQANFETAFYRSTIADNNSYEQWEAEGAQDAAQRANKLCKTMLAEYEAPALDPGDRRGAEGIHRQEEGGGPGFGCVTPMTAVATGRCQCGAVSYKVSGPLRPVVACHCDMCRRISGHFVAATAAMREHIQIASERPCIGTNHPTPRGAASAASAARTCSGRAPASPTISSWPAAWTSRRG